MSTTDTNPASRREVWLSVALAVARDGLPAPDVSMSPLDYEHTPYVYITLHQHSDALAWARHYGVEPSHHTREDLGTHYVVAEFQRDGWWMHLRGVEPLPSPTALEVVAAILTPDAEMLPAELVSA
jgi:hypothetical protein